MAECQLPAWSPLPCPGPISDSCQADPTISPRDLCHSHSLNTTSLAAHDNTLKTHVTWLHLTIEKNKDRGKNFFSLWWENLTTCPFPHNFLGQSPVPCSLPAFFLPSEYPTFYSTILKGHRFLNWEVKEPYNTQDILSTGGKKKIIGKSGSTRQPYLSPWLAWRGFESWPEGFRVI